VWEEPLKRARRRRRLKGHRASTGAGAHPSAPDASAGTRVGSGAAAVARAAVAIAPAAAAAATAARGSVLVEGAGGNVSAADLAALARRPEYWTGTYGDASGPLNVTPRCVLRAEGIALVDGVAASVGAPDELRKRRSANRCRASSRLAWSFCQRSSSSLARRCCESSASDLAAASAAAEIRSCRCSRSAFSICSLCIRSGRVSCLYASGVGYSTNWCCMLSPYCCFRADRKLLDCDFGVSDIAWATVSVLPAATG
jgi:hypothetical protein